VRVGLKSLLLLILLSTLSCRDIQQIDEGEKALLNNREKLQTRINLFGWPFNDRVIHKGNLKDLKIAGTTLKNTVFVRLKITNVIFDSVTFENCDFIAVEFENVSFLNCRVENTLICRSTVKKGVFKKTVFDEVTTVFADRYSEDDAPEKSAYEDINEALRKGEKEEAEALSGKIIEWGKIIGMELHDTSFSDSLFSNCNLEHMKFFSRTFSNVIFNGCRLVWLIADTSEKVMDKNVKLKGCDVSLFLFNNCESITVEGSRAEGISLGKLKAENINIRDSKLRNFSSNEAQCENLIIDNCHVDGFYLGGRIKNMQVTDTELHDILLTAEFESPVLFKDCDMNGITFGRSPRHTKNITFENVRFNYSLVFRNFDYTKKVVSKNKLENIRLRNISYGREINFWYHDLVEYINSDRFPTEGVELNEEGKLGTVEKI